MDAMTYKIDMERLKFLTDPANGSAAAREIIKDSFSNLQMCQVIVADRTLPAPATGSFSVPSPSEKLPTT
jgi:hypothetical protein